MRAFVLTSQTAYEGGRVVGVFSSFDAARAAATLQAEPGEPSVFGALTLNPVTKRRSADTDDRSRSTWFDIEEFEMDTLE